MQKKALLLAVAGISLSMLAARPAMAGFTAEAGPDTVTNVNNGTLPGPEVGDGFDVSGGHFSAYVPDGLSDPQIQGDLNHYGYDLTGTIASLTPTTIDYTGTYDIYYDSNLDGSFDAGDYRVSAGTFTLDATFVTSYTATLSGDLHQTQGPQLSPPFADLSYGGHDVSVTGTYAADLLDNGTTGTIDGTLRQNGGVLVPVPASALSGAALMGGLGLFGWLKKRSRVAV